MLRVCFRHKIIKTNHKAPTNSCLSVMRVMALALAPSQGQTRRDKTTADLQRGAMSMDTSFSSTTTCTSGDLIRRVESPT